MFITINYLTLKSKKTDSIFDAKLCKQELREMIDKTNLQIFLTDSIQFNIPINSKRDRTQMTSREWEDLKETSQIWVKIDPVV